MPAPVVPALGPHALGDQLAVLVADARRAGVDAGAVDSIGCWHARRRPGRGALDRSARPARALRPGRRRRSPAEVRRPRPAHLRRRRRERNPALARRPLLVRERPRRAPAAGRPWRADSPAPDGWKWSGANRSGRSTNCGLTSRTSATATPPAATVARSCSAASRRDQVLSIERSGCGIGVSTPKSGQVPDDDRDVARRQVRHRVAEARRRPAGRHHVADVVAADQDHHRVGLVGPRRRRAVAAGRPSPRRSGRASAARRRRPMRRGDAAREDHAGQLVRGAGAVAHRGRVAEHRPATAGRALRRAGERPAARRARRAR